MSALAEHAERNLDPQVVALLRDQISEAGVETIYYQFVSLNGRVLGKLAPAAHLERNLAKGVQFHGSAIADLTTSRHGVLFGAGPEGEEFVALPDPETFCVLPWDRTFGRFFCRLYRRGDRRELAGTPLPTDPRGALIDAHAAFRSATGLQLKSGCEPEMTWLGPSVDVPTRPNSSTAYNLSALETVRPVVSRVLAYAGAMGFDMIEGDYEDSGQIELNFQFDDCLLTSDRLTTYRQICAQVARELGVTATFMPKPVVGLMANACHHNLSLWRGETNVFEDPGVTELHLSQTARHALGGVLEHAPGAMAIMASTVNSYARFWDAGQFAPALSNWGFDNRTCAVRVSGIGRLEFKLPDAAVNPYLSHTALLGMMRDGLERQLDPGEPQTGSVYDGAPGGELPRTLGDALAAFAQDPLLQGAFAPELTELYADYKRDEWERFCGAVTDWHRETYLGLLP